LYLTTLLLDFIENKYNINKIKSKLLYNNKETKSMVRLSERILVNRGLAQMLKGGVIMDVTNADQARIAEDSGAVAVMALERVP
jgi:hypothetical protein